MEGPDGAGKSTIRNFLFETLEGSGALCILVGQHAWFDPKSARTIIDVRTQRRTHEPEEINDAYLNDKRLMSSLFISPALKSAHVIADRYIYSEAVYHEVLYGIPAGQTLMRHIDAGGLVPDLVVFVDVSADEAFRRILARGEERRFYERTEILAEVTACYRRLFFVEAIPQMPPVIHFMNQDTDWKRRTEEELLPRLEELIGAALWRETTSQDSIGRPESELRRT
jgi:thymidylate kinase